jgi:hypothetical protein
MREHWQMLRKKLRNANGIDVRSSPQPIVSDLSEIEAGLVRLR